MTAIRLASRLRGSRPLSFFSRVTDSAASRWDKSLPSVARVPDTLPDLGVELALDRPVGAEQTHGIERG
jgi:hypothetical protein